MPARKKGKRARARMSPRASGKAAETSKHVRGTGRRYSDAERRGILEVARREHLTGAQVRDRFGISTLTFYTWRKRSGSASLRSDRPPGKARRTGGGTMADIVRREVRARIAGMLPEILKTEIAHALSDSRRR